LNAAGTTKAYPFPLMEDMWERMDDARQLHLFLNSAVGRGVSGCGPLVSLE